MSKKTLKFDSVEVNKKEFHVSQQPMGFNFKIKDDNVRVKYNEIWNKIKKTLHIKFHSEAIDDKEYIKAKVKAKEK